MANRFFLFQCRPYAFTAISDANETAVPPILHLRFTRSHVTRYTRICADSEFVKETKVYPSITGLFSLLP